MKPETTTGKEGKIVFRKLAKAIEASGSRRGFFRMGSAGLAVYAAGRSTALAADDPTQFEITGCGSDVIADDHIWINRQLMDVSDGYVLQNGDVIHCYDPAGSNTDSVITDFEIECTGSNDNPSEPEFVYEDTGDGFEIDLSILESFEENYDPAASGDTPDTSGYSVEDTAGGSIGING
jgi:hypothetical protein